MSSFPKAKRPASARILDAWIRDRAQAEGLLAERIRLGVGYMVVSAVLARMRAEDDTPLFVLKGGVAMQLRFEHRARSSADIDMIFRRKLALSSNRRSRRLPATRSAISPSEPSASPTCSA